jgi:hypothetical protein|tara:strand:- start:1605 stop:1781 length:177 start_codon:yes stop_codon:yes gene_type:complete
MLLSAEEMFRELKPNKDRKKPKKTEKQLFFVKPETIKCPKGMKVCKCGIKAKCVPKKK